MADKTLRLNMSEMSITLEDVPQEWVGLGGRGLTSAIIADEVKPICHPLGEKNKIVFAPGLLSGTPVANAGRLSIGSKSPLTGTIKEANVGGASAQILARLGIKALIIEGMPVDKTIWYALHIDSKGATIKKETETIGMGNFDVVEALNDRLGKEIGVITIGTAGEMRMSAANIFLKDPDTTMRSFSRGGLGAVMGSKKLKCITLQSSGGQVEISDYVAFYKATQNFARALISNPVSKSLAQIGPGSMATAIDEAGASLSRNSSLPTALQYDTFFGKPLVTPIKGRKEVSTRQNTQVRCLAQCPHISAESTLKYLDPGSEYKTIWALGANCGVDDLDLVTEADRLLDDIGLDSTEISAAFGLAMEAGVLRYGDGAEVCRILREEIAKGTPIGRIIGNGAAFVAQAYGISRVPVVKNQAIPPYDPRANKGLGVTYATSPHGAEHFMGYLLASKIYGTEEQLDRLSNKGQVDFSRNLQVTKAAIDSTGLSLFIAFPAFKDPLCLPALIGMINARFGISLATEDAISLGERILKIERRFNLEAGLTNKDDRLPEFFKYEPIASLNTVWDMTDEDIDTFWDFYGLSD